MRHSDTTKQAAAPPAPDKLITTRELIARSTLSRSTLWRIEQADELLRRAKVQLTPTRIAWREARIQSWIESRSEAR